MGASIRAGPRAAMRNSANTGVLERGKKHDGQQNLHMRNRKGSRGVTLIELCFGLAVVAILAGLAVPSMRGVLRAGAVRSATLELLAGVQQTRATSILAARTATLCLSDQAGNCLHGNAPAGAWSAFLDDDGNTRTLDRRELPAGIVLRASRNRLDFWPYALAASTNTLTICDSQGIAPPRTIVISQTGRVRLEDGARASCDP
jgi:prepilin-type N-terminal cleavage/methylation domain-containing protein